MYVHTSIYLSIYLYKITPPLPATGLWNSVKVLDAEWSLFPTNKKWETQKGFCAQEPHRVLLGSIILLALWKESEVFIWFGAGRYTVKKVVGPNGEILRSTGGRKMRMNPCYWYRCIEQSSLCVLLSVSVYLLICFISRKSGEARSADEMAYR